MCLLQPNSSFPQRGIGIQSPSDSIQGEVGAAGSSDRVGRARYVVGAFVQTSELSVSVLKDAWASTFLGCSPFRVGKDP